MYANDRNDFYLKALLGITEKPKVFISYQHSNDQYWYNQFSYIFSDIYDLLSDNSLQRKYDSEETDYIDRSIRENNITGSSVTIVLCGKETWKRKYVDWEIYATLYKKHALLGIILPTLLPNINNKYIVTGRLHDNISSAYAHWILWTNDPKEISIAIATAKQYARFTSNINNTREKMKRNLS